MHRVNPRSKHTTPNVSAFPQEQKFYRNLSKKVENRTIRPSTQPMALHFLFCQEKKEGSLAYPRLSKTQHITIKIAYPLPIISELLISSGAQVFSKMDVRWGYNNIESRKETKGTAHLEPKSDSLEPTVMFSFGLTTHPPHFNV